jgi:hypothetical protein
MLCKFPAPLQRFTWQWRLNERTRKSGAVRADGETPHASASGPDSYTRRLNSARARFRALIVLFRSLILCKIGVG